MILGLLRLIQIPKISRCKPVFFEKEPSCKKSNASFAPLLKYKIYAASFLFVRSDSSL